jgi:uncharacterized protein YigA (DUF484 family)
MKMTGPQNDAASEKPSELSGEQVSNFLSNNPNFFEENPDTLKSIEVPSRWSGDGVVDMQKFMLEQLRGEIDNLRDCTQDVIETSRTNMSVQTRTHTAVLALLSASNFNQLISVISEDFPLLLDIHVAKIGFEPANSPETEIQSDAVTRYLPGDVDQLTGPDQDVVLMQNVNDDGSLFGEEAVLIHSAALARLRPGLRTPTGLLALGAKGSAFYPGQGTELIGFLARVLERCIDRCLTATD